MTDQNLITRTMTDHFWGTTNQIGALSTNHIGAPRVRGTSGHKRDWLTLATCAGLIRAQIFIGSYGTRIPPGCQPKNIVLCPAFLVCALCAPKCPLGHRQKWNKLPNFCNLMTLLSMQTPSDNTDIPLCNKYCE